ncbi:hypothetical protein DY000_02015495 [Brassica cretica]|uniref:Uncharacterized protein n=1 Tax=Brassica cretica TaxID=69181 RepID=A0ABQ7D7E8_BRACR|nr:hypothetical protein DY000_02015495 [Brassica cretica]
MSSTTRSNKEIQLLFSPDLASLERSIRKKAHSSSIVNNTCLSLDFVQPPSTQTLVPSTDTRSPPSTEDTHLPSTDIIHLTSIDTEPRDMVATLILVRDERGDLHDQEGPLRNAAVVKEEKLQEGDFKVESLMSFGGSHWCRSTPDHAHRSTVPNPNRSIGSPELRSMTPTESIASYGVNRILQCHVDIDRQPQSHLTESIASCNAVRILTHEEFAAKHPHPPNPDNVRIARHTATPIDRQTDVDIDRQPPAPIDRRAPITYRVQMPKIDVARLNALRPKPKPSENPPETVRIPSDDGEDSMEVDRKPQTSSRRIIDPGIIAACHCGVEYETEYSTSIETHIATSIDGDTQTSTDKPQDESADSCPIDWENDYYNPTIAAYTRQNMHTEEYDEDYEDERATEYKAILEEEDTLLHHSSWKRNAPSIDMIVS